MNAISSSKLTSPIHFYTATINKEPIVFPWHGIGDVVSATIIEPPREVFSFGLNCTLFASLCGCGWSQTSVWVHPHSCSR